MTYRLTFKKIISLFLCVLLAAGMIACGKDAKGAKDNASNEADEALQNALSVRKYAFIPATPESDLFGKKEAEGFEEAVRSLGAEPIVLYPEEDDAESQVAVISALIARGVDGICIDARDPRVLNTALREAREAGITVCSAGSSLLPAQRALHICQSSTDGIAKALAEAILDLAGGEGEYAILTTTMKAQTENAYIDAMLEIMKNDPAYGSLSLVEKSYGNDDIGVSSELTKSLIENHPDLKVICAPSTTALFAAACAIQGEPLIEDEEDTEGADTDEGADAAGDSGNGAGAAGANDAGNATANDAGNANAGGNADNANTDNANDEEAESEAEELPGVKITGFGHPSEMKYFIGDDAYHACPYMFLWNPSDLGALGGYAIVALCSGDITGEVGQTLNCASGTYTIEQAPDGGTQIILGPPFRFDSSNIDEWAGIY